MVFRRVSKKKQTVDADGLLPEHVPVALWAGGCLRERHEEDWRVYCSAVILRSRARRGHSRARRRRSATRTRQVRGEPPFAARPARGPPARKAFVVSTNSKRIVRHAEEGALHVGHRATCFRPWCGGTPPRVGNRPARRGSRRGKRLPMAFRIPRATPAPKRDSEPRDPRAPPKNPESARIGNNARASRSTRFPNSGI